MSGKTDDKKQEINAGKICTENEKPAFQPSENWAQEIIEDLDDFIEEQGIYLRQ